jgi:hypothetical protein
MICAGLGAAAITLGPVLLWYDRDFLGMGTDQLHATNHHLRPESTTVDSLAGRAGPRAPAGMTGPASAGP